LRVSPKLVERFVTSLGKTLPPPWTAEHRHAFAAAIGGLSEVEADAGCLHLGATNNWP
jgi:hypothetical protein